MLGPQFRLVQRVAWWTCPHLRWDALTAIRQLLPRVEDRFALRTGSTLRDTQGYPGRCGAALHDAMPVKGATIFKTPTADDLALAEVVRRLVAAYEPERIYLFGSVARGDADSDSDYDLLIVVRDDAPAEHLRSRLAYEALVGTGTAADVPVCTRSYCEDRRSLKASLPGTVLREGRLLHAA